MPLPFLNTSREDKGFVRDYRDNTVIKGANTLPGYHILSGLLPLQGQVYLRYVANGKLPLYEAGPGQNPGADDSRYADPIRSTTHNHHPQAVGPKYGFQTHHHQHYHMHIRP